MSIDLTVAADLEFTVDLPGSRTVRGSLTGSGTQLELRLSDPFLFAGRSDASAVRGIADGLARRGVSLSVVAPAGPLVTLGVPRTSWLQRRLTGSRHIRVERGAGVWSLIRGRAHGPAGGALPPSELAPPTTLFPLVPTLRRRTRRPITTTHDPHRGGDPRLIMALPEYLLPGDRQEVFRLRSEVTTIGSDDTCDIRLAGLDPFARRGPTRRRRRVRRGPARSARQHPGQRRTGRRGAAAHGLPARPRDLDHVVLP